MSLVTRRGLIRIASLATALILFISPALSQFNRCKPGFCSPLSAPSFTGTWNPSDKSTANIVLSNGNLTATVTASAIGNNGVRTTASNSSGKFYWEVTVGTVNSTSDNTCIGITTGAQSLTGISGSNGVNSFIVYADTSVFYNGSSAGIPNAGGGLANAVWSFALDMNAKLIWVRKGAGSWNGNGGNNPATGVGGFNISSVFGSVAAFPMFGPNNNAVVTINLGATAFSNSVPSGFVAGFP